MPRIYKAITGILDYRPPRLRVVLADERTILRRGVRAMLVGEPDLEIIGEATRVSDAIALARCLQPDVIITDIFEDGSGIQAIRIAGAHAYVTIDSPIEVLLRAIRAENSDVDGRRRWTEAPAAAPLAEITAREREVLIGVALGYSSKRIAGNLGRSVKTIEKHRFKMMHKLGLRNTAAVTRYAMDNGLLNPGSDAQELRPARPSSEN